MGITVLSGCWVNGDSLNFLCVYLNPLPATTTTTKKRAIQNLSQAAWGLGKVSASKRDQDTSGNFSPNGLSQLEGCGELEGRHGTQPLI